MLSEEQKLLLASCLQKRKLLLECIKLRLEIKKVKKDLESAVNLLKCCLNSKICSDINGVEGYSNKIMILLIARGCYRFIGFCFKI